MKRHKKKAIKIAVISKSFPPDVKGGSECVIYKIWEQARDIYNVTLILGWRDNPANIPNSAHKIHLSGKNKILDYIKFYFFCRGILKKERPDLILINAFEAPLGSVPSISIVHALNHDQPFYKDNKIKKFIIKRRIRNASKIIAVSEYIKNEIIKLSIDKKKIKVIYSGVDYDKFKPMPKTNGKFSVVYPSRIVESKGQHVAIEAMKNIPDDILKNIELILTGYTQDFKYLHKLQKLSQGLPVTIEPDIPNIEKYYNKADIIVFPTLMQEGFPLTPIEAMACAKPVIHSDFPAIKEATGNLGIKVIPGDSKELSSQMQRLYANKDLRIDLARKGLEYVKAHYNWDRTFKEYQKTFEEILNKDDVVL